MRRGFVIKRMCDEMGVLKSEGVLMDDRRSLYNCRWRGWDMRRGFVIKSYKEIALGSLVGYVYKESYEDGAIGDGGNRPMTCHIKLCDYQMREYSHIRHCSN